MRLRKLWRWPRVVRREACVEEHIDARCVYTIGPGHDQVAGLTDLPALPPPQDEIIRAIALSTMIPREILDELPESSHLAVIRAMRESGTPYRTGTLRRSMSGRPALDDDTHEGAG